MPYIAPVKRYILYEPLNRLLSELSYENFNEGELNYVFFCISKAAYDSNPRYATINKVIGAIECSKQEYYRVIVGPHEDEAINKNGNI